MANDHDYDSDIIAESPNRKKSRKESTSPKLVLKTPQSLVHIKHSISLKQYKLWIIMLKHYKEKFDKGEISQDLFIIPKSELDSFFGYENAKHEIEKDLEALRKEPIIFNVLKKDGESEQQGQGFISEWTLSPSKVGFLLPSYIAEAVQGLQHARLFSLLNLSIFNQFSGKYEAFLYKLCADYVGIQRTPEMAIEAYRSYMGLKPGEYEAGRDLNKFIIQAPVDKINENDICDIQVEPIYKRQGRKIVSIYFKVQYKKQGILDFPLVPAFAEARIPIPLSAQSRYMTNFSADEIALSIERGNSYIDALKGRGANIDLGAIYNKAIEENWGAQLAAQKQADAQERASQASRKAAVLKQEHSEDELKLRATYLKELQTTSIKAMSDESIRAEAKVYLDANPQSARFYDENKPGFTNPMERIGFNIWLQARQSIQIDESLFSAWQESRRKRPGRVAWAI